MYGKGTQQDSDSAMKYFLTAADGGDERAQIYVGINYADGKGVERNLDKAKEYLEKAAKSGDAFALKLIEEMNKTV